MVTSATVSIWRREPDTDLTDTSGAGFPRKLLLSIHSGCTLRCAHCVRGHFPNDAGHVMSRDTLDQIVLDFFPRVSAVWLGGLDLGEQMQSPHFDYLLERAQQYPHLDVDVISSGVALTPARAALIARSLSHLSLSVEGTGDHYASVRGMRWPALERRMDWLTASRANHTRASGERLRLSLHVTVLREFRDDGHALIDMAARWQVAWIDFRHFIPLLPEQTASSLLYYPDESNGFFRELAAHAADAGVAITMPAEVHAGQPQPPRRACHLPFETLGIHADGRFTSCCNASFRLGGYTHGVENVARAWTAAPYAELRATVNSDRPLAACERCDAVNDDPRSYRPGFSGVDRIKLRLKQAFPAAVTRRLQGV